jgi:CheY-like chemotaxis protein
MTSTILRPSTNRVGTVLLVEDNQDDAFFMERACHSADIPHSLNIVHDGQAAVDYLSGTNGYEDRERHPLPDLILLELKLPLRTGYEVLEWLRAQPALRTLPVVILTTSTRDPDIEHAYQLGVSSYLVKDADYVQLFEATWVILKYWLQLNVRPK